MTAMVIQGTSGLYELDVKRSRIGFTARHALIAKVHGHFGEFEGTAHLDFDDPSSSSAELTIQVASVDTANVSRDEQLRVNEFLDAPAYPTITFTSTAVEQISDRRFDVTGDLTIKAATREVTVQFDLLERAPESDRISLKGKASINRRDWKVEWPAPLETGGVLVGDKVAVVIDVIANKAEGF